MTKNENLIQIDFDATLPIYRIKIRMDEPIILIEFTCRLIFCSNRHAMNGYILDKLFMNAQK
jgi:hypothetical protein